MSSKEYKSMSEYGLAERRIERRARKSGRGISGAEYGLAENKIERHIEDHVQRHLKRIADTTLTFLRNHHFDWLIIGGQEENRSGFEQTLHHDLKERIIGRIKADPKSSLSAVHEESLNLILEVESDRKNKLVERIVEANQPYGLGVLGVRATLYALGQGVVQTLVVQDGVERPGARCPSCGHLNMGEKTCLECESPTHPVSDLVEEAIEQAISQSAHVIYVPRNSTLEQSGGLGALLRYQPAKNTNLAKGAA